mgnify:CR=1 FL=1
MKARWRRLREDPKLQIWLPAGLLGGSSGALAVGWLLWGPPRLLNSSLCFVITGPLAILALLFVSSMGISFVILLQRLFKAVRQTMRPLSVSMYEPAEPLIEMEVVAWPHPGCGLLIYIPMILLSGGASLPWFWFGIRHTPVVPLLLLLVIGVPTGLWIAKREARYW